MKELEITAAEWKKYKDKLRRISEKAADQMQAYAESHNFQMDQAMIDYAYALSTKYGEASAELACEMYDELAEYWHADVPQAVPANTATYGEVEKAMRGSMKQSPEGNLISSVTDRLVKMAGADTTIKNAIRDGAYWAWIPTGDTCAFCITLASRGWQRASKKVLSGDHAEHIHAHCDCTFAIAFKPSDTEKYPFYDPDKYYQQYMDANGDINAMRRKIYPDIAEARNARRRKQFVVQTGGKYRVGSNKWLENNEKKEAAAAKCYEYQRNRSDDIKAIAKTTGFSEEDIKTVKNHVFYDEHILYDGSRRRFMPDFDMSVAWERLENGNPEERDLLLIRHELLEAQVEKKYNLTASEAHDLSNKKFNWEKKVLSELGEDGEDYDLWQANRKK